MAKPLRILVVDDNKELVTTTMELVRLMGHQCHGCHTGKQAVECVDEFEPDVLIMAKLGIEDLPSLVRFAVRHGLIKP